MTSTSERDGLESCAAGVDVPTVIDLSKDTARGPLVVAAENGDALNHFVREIVDDARHLEKSAGIVGSKTGSERKSGN